jgi:hypothetical protein
MRQRSGGGARRCIAPAGGRWKGQRTSCSARAALEGSAGWALLCSSRVTLLVMKPWPACGEERGAGWVGGWVTSG